MFQSNLISLIIIFTMAFSQGIFSFLGIPTIVPRTIMELVIILLFMKAFCTKSLTKDRFIVFGLLPMLGLFLISILSVYVNNEQIFPFTLFCRHVFIFYCFFLALLNLKISETAISKVNNYLVFLFLIQVFANFVKLLTVGQEEGRGIGTMSMQAGSLTTMFTLFALAFSYALYSFKRNIKYLVLMTGFLLFSLIGEKRAVVFYLPVLLLVQTHFYAKRYKSKIPLFLRVTHLKAVFLIAIISLVSIYFASKMIYSLNPEQVRGGDFNVKFLAGKIVKYNLRTSSTGGQLGRYVTTVHAYRSLKKTGITKALFGTGAGNLITSQILPERPKKITDITSEKFGIESGITGFAWFVLQVGVIGVIFLLCFYFNVFRKAYRLYRQSSDENYKAIALGFLGVNVVFFLDFFTYSKTTLTSGVLTPVYFYIAFILFRGFALKHQKYHDYITNQSAKKQ